MIDIALKSDVIDLIEEMFDEKSIDRDVIEYLNFAEDLGMDSITFITLVVEIENRYKITIPDEVLLVDNLNNVDSILRVVEQGLLKKGDISYVKA